MKRPFLKFAAAGALLALVLSGCSVVSANRVFPKVTWYWSADAKAQRAERKAEHQAAAEYQRTNSPTQ